MSKTSKSVAIIGANGRVAREVTKAFRDAQWRVRAVTRKGDCTVEGIENVKGDAFDAASLTAATEGFSFIFHGTNPAYTDWRDTVVPMLASTLAAAKANGATILFPGNVYNYGSEIPEHPREDSQQVGNHEKSRLRTQMESMLEDASREGVRSVILRPGDFFGGEGRGSWFDLGLASKAASGKVVWLAKGGIVHAWAYLPDLARAFVAAAENADKLPAFATFQFGGHNVTMEEMHSAMERAIERPLRRSALPWWMIRLAAPFVPMFREFVIMSYLWRRPHRLTGEKFETAIGPLPHTELDQAVAAALRELGIKTVDSKTAGNAAFTTHAA